MSCESFSAKISKFLRMNNPPFNPNPFFFNFLIFLFLVPQRCQNRYARRVGTKPKTRLPWLSTWKVIKQMPSRIFTILLYILLYTNIFLCFLVIYAQYVWKKADTIFCTMEREGQTMRKESTSKFLFYSKSFVNTV